MIGQNGLLSRIDKLVEKGFPRFVLLVGQEGSGKKLLSKEIANKLGFPLVPIGTGVDEVREVIANSYRNTEPIVYVLADTDKMSVGAKNALLKITEEPPQKAYFIMTVANTANTLPTVLSRACVLNLDPYTVEELTEYLQLKHDIKKLSEDEIEFITRTCYVPKEVDTLMSYDLKEFKKYVETICNSLHTVNAANCFKIENKLALKKDEEKWDVLLTLQAIKSIYLNFLFYGDNKDLRYFDCYRCVTKTITDIQTKNSVNKQYCLDQMILEIRKIWR